jgi:hypothetical protein
MLKTEIVQYLAAVYTDSASLATKCEIAEVYLPEHIDPAELPRYQLDGIISEHYKEEFFSLTDEFLHQIYIVVVKAGGVPNV